MFREAFSRTVTKFLCYYIYGVDEAADDESIKKRRCQTQTSKDGEQKKRYRTCLEFIYCSV